MKKIVICLALIICGIGMYFIPIKKDDGVLTVGVLVPMEHEALTQIISGLKNELHQQYGKHIRIKVLNAQGDLNFQRACLEKFLNDKSCSIIVPIGTSASQMALRIIKDKDVVCLAADKAIIPNHGKIKATALDDNLSASDSFTFVHSLFPRIKKITLLYSASEKVAKEIPIVVKTAAALGIEIQKLMVQTHADLYTVSRAIADDSEAVFILKDHLIVSGIQTVVQEAQKKRIPVITSDEGSVIGGAAFAIGVKESDIGIQGAKIIKSILKGKSSALIPPATMNGPFPLFINRKACQRQGVNVKELMSRAHLKNIPVHVVD